MSQSIKRIRSEWPTLKESDFKLKFSMLGLGYLRFETSIILGIINFLVEYSQGR